METIHFIIKYIPFWGVPTCIICVQFTLLYWKKEYRKTAIIFAITGFFSFLFIAYYFWAGNGHAAVKYFMDFCRILTEY
ncbi:MAG: hypothetical protein OXB84_04645 [Halobacteriovoraceae bacterium]|nr:hypothetical protein [Halobacteriovoraceae bacterium]